MVGSSATIPVPYPAPGDRVARIRTAARAKITPSAMAAWSRTRVGACRCRRAR